ncbi:hypothetical protein B0H11DRAFT_1977057 [Mycena galericulata]|nr:hypothetical protein B0H11DRAFT_1977057 [Mycena galericulata]
MRALTLLNYPLNSTFFLGNLPSGIEVHTGFRDEHALTAQEIQTAVKSLIASKGATQVTVVILLYVLYCSRIIGIGIGWTQPWRCLAELDAFSLRKVNLPISVGVNAVTYGTLRVGNEQFVSFFDSQVTDFKRVNNRDDLLPIVPGRFLGFSHPQGEIHIVSDDTNQIVACPGSYYSTEVSCFLKHSLFQETMMRPMINARSRQSPYSVGKHRISQDNILYSAMSPFGTC